MPVAMAEQVSTADDGVAGLRLSGHDVGVAALRRTAESDQDRPVGEEGATAPAAVAAIVWGAAWAPEPILARAPRVGETSTASVVSTVGRVDPDPWWCDFCVGWRRITRRDR